MQFRPPLMRHMTFPVLHVPSLRRFYMMMGWQMKKVQQIDDDDVQEADIGRILESTFVLVQDEND